MRHLLLAHVVALLFLVMLGETGIAKDDKSEKGVAFNTCAPWDGAAVKVKIGVTSADDTSMPQLSLALWKPLPLEAGNVYEVDHSKVAAASYCPKKNGCAPLIGKITFTRIEKEKWVEGHYDLKSMKEEGKVFKGKFRAVWVKVEHICG